MSRTCNPVGLIFFRARHELLNSLFQTGHKFEGIHRRHVHGKHKVRINHHHQIYSWILFIIFRRNSHIVLNQFIHWNSEFNRIYTRRECVLFFFIIILVIKMWKPLCSLFQPAKTFIENHFAHRCCVAFKNRIFIIFHLSLLLFNWFFLYTPTNGSKPNESIKIH